MTGSALVTGASRGIGAGIAEDLARRGLALTVAGRDPERLAAVAGTLREAGAPDVVALAGDMADEAHLRELAAAHADRFGAMSVLVLNAGVGTAGSVAELPLRRFDKQVQVNLRAPFLLLQACLPLLRRHAAGHPERGARVLALASIAGVYAEPGLAAYGATKAALISLVDAVNAEESAGGVSATAIAPAYVETDMSAWTHDTVPPETMISVSDIVRLAGAVVDLSARAVVPRIVIARAGTTGYTA